MLDGRCGISVSFVYLLLAKRALARPRYSSGQLSYDKNVNKNNILCFFQAVFQRIGDGICADGPRPCQVPLHQGRQIDEIAKLYQTR